MPSSSYTLLRAADAPEYTGDAPGAFLGYGRAMGSAQLAVNVRVLDGEITLKLGDDVLTRGPRDAVLIPPETPRAARNDTDAPAAFAMISMKVEDYAAESQGHDGFWA